MENIKQFYINTFLFLIIGITGFTQIEDSARLILNRFRTNKNYSKAIHFLNSYITEDSSYILDYNLACFYTLNKEPNEAFTHLKAAIQKGAPAEDIYTDTDFINLYKTSLWPIIDSMLINNYKSSLVKVKHPNISIELWKMGIEDQRFKTLHNNYKKDFPPNGSKKLQKFNMKRTQIKKAREKELDRIIRKIGWPSPYKVGDQASKTAFLIVQHSMNGIKRKYVRLVHKEMKENQIPAKYYAFLKDRFLIQKKGYQMYGTQIGGRVKTNTQGNPEIYEYYLKPLQKPEEVDSLRSLLGLKPLNKYLKNWNIKYEPQ